MAAKDLGPLDWREPIVDGAGRPSPEFQRRWNTQRTNNGLIGFVGIGDGPPTDPPTGDGEVYVDITSSPNMLYVATEGAWDPVGVVNFTDLADVPHDYTGAASKLVRVTGAEDALEFATVSEALDVLGAVEGDILVRGASGWQPLVIGSADDVLTTNGTDPAWGNISAILDAISSTQGAILFRGASGWEALAPGTAGDVLSTGGAGADPSWIAGGGGGGVLSLISEVVTSGSQTSVTFSSIPNTYRDLVLVIRGRGTTSAAVIDMRYQINGDAGSNYEYQEFRGTDGTTANAQSINQTSAFFGYFPAATASANYAGLIDTRFGDYKGTTFFKVALGNTSFSLGNGSFSQGAGVTSSIWINTAAISSLFIFPSLGGFVDGSVVSLYGSS